MIQTGEKADSAAQEGISEGRWITMKKQAVNNKSTVSYDAMIKSKRLDSFFEEEKPE